MDLIIPARRLDLVSNNTKNLSICGFCRSSRLQVPEPYQSSKEMTSVGYVEKETKQSTA